MSFSSISDDDLTQEILNDKYGSMEIHPPTQENGSQDTTGRNALIHQILNVLYEEILQAKNHKLIKNGLIIPIISHMIISIKPFIITLSTLFLLSIVMTTIVLIVLIVKKT